MMNVVLKIISYVMKDLYTQDFQIKSIHLTKGFCNKTINNKIKCTTKTCPQLHETFLSLSTDKTCLLILRMIVSQYSNGFRRF